MTGTKLDRELLRFLDGRSADFRQPLEFGGGKHRLILTAYLTVDQPPDSLILAGRALVLQDREVLVIKDPDGEHVLPGGRREAGESPEDAVKREVLEEAGWTLRELEPFAALHLHYETPRPTGVGRVIYPDFIWQVFRAKPKDHVPDRRVIGDWEEDAYFRPVSAMIEVVEPYQRLLLEASLA